MGRINMTLTSQRRTRVNLDSAAKSIPWGTIACILGLGLLLLLSQSCANRNSLVSSVNFASGIPGDGTSNPDATPTPAATATDPDATPTPTATTPDATPTPSAAPTPA